MTAIEIRMANDGLIGLTKNNEKFHREVSTEEMMGILREGSTFSSGLLPPNTRYYAKKGMVTLLALEIVPTKRTIQLSGSSVNEVPLPGGAYITRVVEANGSFMFGGVGLWAVASGGIQGLDQELYRFPTSNTDAVGTICWGDQRDPTFSMKAIAGVEHMMRSFFTSRFNTHMWGSDALSAAGLAAIPDYHNPEGYFKKLKETGTFPDEWLNKAKLTFRTALNRVGYDVVAL